MLFFVGPVRGYEDLWIVGDEFAKNTFHSTVLQNNSLQFYIKETFNIYEFTSDRTNEGNVLNRIFNNIVRGMNQQILLPKIILIVLDNDLMKNIKGKNRVTEKVINETIEYLISDIHQEIKDHRDQLPMKAQKFKYPTVLWMIPPCHANFTNNLRRQQLARALETTVMNHNEMCFMCTRLWDFNNLELVPSTTMGYKFSRRGLIQYWMAIDAAIKYWNSTHSEVRQYKQTKKGHKKMKWSK